MVALLDLLLFCLEAIVVGIRITMAGAVHQRRRGNRTAARTNGGVKDGIGAADDDIDGESSSCSSSISSSSSMSKNWFLLSCFVAAGAIIGLSVYDARSAHAGRKLQRHSPEPSLREVLKWQADKLRNAMLPRALTQSCRDKIAQRADYLEREFERRLPRHAYAELNCPVSWVAGTNAKASQFSWDGRGRPPPWTPQGREDDDRVRIAFIIQLYSKEKRSQLHRLLTALVDPDHVYVFTIDPRPDDARGSNLAALKVYIKEFMSSAGVSADRYRIVSHIDVLYTGPSLVQATLLAMKQLFADGIPPWDFCINLSGSDYPIKSLDYMSEYLRVWGNASYTESFLQVPDYIHGRGLLDFGVECPKEPCGDHRGKFPSAPMPDDAAEGQECSGYVLHENWGRRPVMQLSNMFGGSAWFALHRHFAGYAVECVYGEKVKTSWSASRTSKEAQQDAAYCASVRGMVEYFSDTWSPEETLIQTVLYNGPFCDHVRPGNLRWVHWNKKSKVRDKCGGDKRSRLEMRTHDRLSTRPHCLDETAAAAFMPPRKCKVLLENLETVTEEEGRSSVAKARECFHYTPFIARKFNLDILPGAYDASDDAANAWDDYFDSLDIIAQDSETRRSKWRAF